MKKLLILLTCAAAVYAQEINITATNTMRFGLGREWGGPAKDIEIPKQYFEDWIDVEASKGNFTAGLRFEAADSSSHNESLKEITKLYFRYSNKGINITAGDFYGSFGRGLVFGLKESKPDFFDSKITGGKFEYSGEMFGFKALGGKSYFKYINDWDPAQQTVEQMNNSVLGGEVFLPVSSYLGLENLSVGIGLSYLNVKGDFVEETQYLYGEMFIEETNIGGLSAEIIWSDLEFYNEYAIKTTERTPSQTGWANYSSVSYAVRGFSLGLEFKDYYKYGANPNDQASGFTPYQNAPELIIVHSSHLLNTHPHQVNPNDEIGYKLSAAYQLNDRLDLNGSFAFSSRHNGDSVIPEYDEQYLPYLDVWLGSGFVEEKYGITAGAGYFSDAPLSKGINQLIIPGEEGQPDVYSDQRITFTGEYFFKVNEKSKLAFCGEFQTVSNDYLGEDYNDIYVSSEYSYSPLGYISVSLIKSSQEVSGDAPDMWLGFETGIDITDSHKLELFYGRERAGVKCSGGTCRQVPEFDGFRMTLISEF
jgi:hypothetical protein